MMKPLIVSTPKRILDWDVETIAAGFADPNWVPQFITVVAWSWVGSDEVHAHTRLGSRDEMLKEIRHLVSSADMVTGHNMLRFDLPILQSELLRNGFASLPPVLVQDTIKLVKTKGFKKGQDNLSTLLRVPAGKMALSWQEWQDAYDEEDWQTVVDRCKGDVVQHKLMRAEMLERGWLKPPVLWKP